MKTVRNKHYHFWKKKRKHVSEMIRARMTYYANYASWNNHLSQQEFFLSRLG